LGWLAGCGPVGVGVAAAATGSPGCRVGVVCRVRAGAGVGCFRPPVQGPPLAMIEGQVRGLVGHLLAGHDTRTEAQRIDVIAEIDAGIHMLSAAGGRRRWGWPGGCHRPPSTTNSPTPAPSPTTSPTCYRRVW